MPAKKTKGNLPKSALPQRLSFPMSALRYKSLHDSTLFISQNPERYDEVMTHWDKELAKVGKGVSFMKGRTHIEIPAKSIRTMLAFARDEKLTRREVKGCVAALTKHYQEKEAGEIRTRMASQRR